MSFLNKYRQSTATTTATTPTHNGQTVQYVPGQPYKPTWTIIPSTPQDNSNTAALVEFLGNYKLCDSPEVSKKRHYVLTQLNTIIQGWIHSEVRRKNIPEPEVKSYRAELISFGSYRLGVNSETGDIDLLCVCPKIVTRDDFFNNLRPKIEGHREVTDFTAVPGAFVPVMTFRFAGIEMDLIFGQVAVPKLPPVFDVTENRYLLNIDKKDVKSLNGTRVTDRILQLVPEQSSFRNVLRFVKLWAKKRGVYSNVFGFLGGVSWAILTAHTCQLDPTTASIHVLRSFFRIMSTWEWPKPVYLCPTENDEQMYKICPTLDPIWLPERNPNDIVPIITPAFPCMNSTYNIQTVTKRIIVSELARGDQICSKLDKEVLTKEEIQAVLAELIQDADFFSQYLDYIDVNIIATSEAEMSVWAGWVESKMRLFFNELYATNLNPTTRAPRLLLRPWPFRVDDPGEGKFEYHFFIGMEFKCPRSELAELDFSTAFTNFQRVIANYPQKNANMSAKLSHTKWKDLPLFVFPNQTRPKAPIPLLKRKVIPKAAPAVAEGAEFGQIVHAEGNLKPTFTPQNPATIVDEKQNELVQLSHSSHPTITTVSDQHLASIDQPPPLQEG